MTTKNPYSGNGGYKGNGFGGYNRYNRNGNSGDSGSARRGSTSERSQHTHSSSAHNRTGSTRGTGSARSVAKRNPSAAARHTTGQGGSGSHNGYTPKATKNKKRSFRQLKTWKKILLAIAAFFAACAVGLMCYVAVVLISLPSWDETSLLHDSSSILYDSEGQVFEELHAGQNRTPVELEDMPQYLIDCALASEDTRFYDHHGIDIIRIFGAAIADLKAGGAAQGASTITMQLARNAILEDQSKNLTRKIKEAAIAIQIENHYEKDEILEMYLNEIYFGHGAYGVQIAAQKYLGVDVGDLTLAQCAMLIGIIRSPNNYSPYDDMEKAYQVRDSVLTALEKYKPEYANQIAEARNEEIVVADTSDQDVDNPYGWYTDYVISEAEDILESLNIDSYAVYTGGYQIYTTMNSTVQELMNEAYSDPDNFPSSSSADQVESAMVVLDVKTGGILGLVGGREYTTQRGYNRAYDMTRQPGSTYKPIGVFAPAIEAGLSPGSVVNDVKTTFPGNYTPRNYDGSQNGMVTMRDAARESMNVPAVKFLQQIGTDASIEMAGKLGIDLDPSVDGNLSMALGGLTYGISPLQMAAAYAAFGNSGVYSEPFAITKILDRNGEEIYTNTLVQHEAMKETTAYLVTSMLETVTTSGTGTRAQLPNRSVASKTGTVQLPDTPAFHNVTGNKDAWFAAYTPEMVGVVWMGYDNDTDSNGEPQYLRQIYGGRYPAQIWKYVIGGASEDLPSSTFTRPNGIVSASIDIKSGLLPSSLTPSQFIKTELFAEGTVPTEVSDVWHQATVCTQTGLIATDYCPNTTTKSLFVPPEEPEGNKVIGTGADRSWQYTGRTCTTHTSAQNSSMVLTYICTDSSHNGEEVLANIPGSNQSGGCPSSSIKAKYYPAGKVPTKYCTISSHQITSGGNTDPDDSPQSIPTVSGLSANVSGTTATVSWSYSGSVEPIFQVEYSDGSTTNQVDTSSYSTTISNLQSGKTYTFRVRVVDANNHSNTGSWSNQVSVSVP